MAVEVDGFLPLCRQRAQKKPLRAPSSACTGPFNTRGRTGAGPCDRQRDKLLGLNSGAAIAATAWPAGRMRRRTGAGGSFDKAAELGGRADTPADATAPAAIAALAP